MKTSFATLCTLEVVHAYYGGVSRDFSFLITDATAQTLRRARLLAKVIDGRLYLLFEQAAGGGPFVPAAGTVIHIGLRVNTPFFGNVTALGFDSRSTIAVYDNTANPKALGAIVPASLSGAIVAHPLKTKQGAVDVTVKTADGQQVAAAAVAAAADQPVVSFDLSAHPRGRYTIAEASPGGAPATTTYFLDPELVREAVFGVVSIQVDAAHYAAPAAFTINFSAREETLTYFIVTHDLPQADFEKLKIEDAGEPTRDKIAFTERIPDAELTAAEKQVIAVLPGSGETRVAVFRSKDPVERRAQGYGRIELKRNGEAIIKNLPQAGAERPTADLIFQLSRPK